MNESLFFSYLIELASKVWENRSRSWVFISSLSVDSFHIVLYKILSGFITRSVYIIGVSKSSDFFTQFLCLRLIEHLIDAQHGIMCCGSS